jgi:hypothetical protein
MTKLCVSNSINRVGIFISLILLATSLSAQITNIAPDQTPPIEGAGHDYIKMLNETVNPATGAVSIRIGVPVPPSRGFSVPFSIGYDSNAALHVVGAGYADNRGYLGQGGWTYLVPHLTALYGDVSYIWEGKGVQCRYYYDYMLTDLQGGSHALGISVVEPQNENPGDCSPQQSVLLPRPSVTYGADEQVQAVTTDLSAGNFTPPHVTVADVDGTTYYFSPSGEETPVGTLPSWIEDRNGNKAMFTTGSNGAFTVTDSNSRAAITTSSFGNPTDTITVSGLPNSYSVTWAAGPNPGLSPTETVIEFGKNINCMPGAGAQCHFRR